MNFLAFSSSELGDLKENEIFAEVNIFFYVNSMLNSTVLKLAVDSVNLGFNPFTV